MPCYVIEFGSRRVEFFPLLLTTVRRLAEDTPKENETDRAHLNRKQFESFLEAAQRGDPSVTMADIEAVVDTEHVKALTRAIYSMPPEKSGEEAANVPTSPQIGG